MNKRLLGWLTGWGVCLLVGGMAAVETPIPPPSPSVATEEPAPPPAAPTETTPDEPPTPPDEPAAEKSFAPPRSKAARACLEQGQQLFAADDYEGAMWLLDLALKFDETLAEAHFWRGRVYFAQDELDPAAREFKAVLAQRPDAAETLYQLGRVVEEKERLEEAWVLYRRVQTLAPGHAEAQAALARLGLVPPGFPPRLEDVLARADYTSPPQRLKRRLRKRQAVTVVALGDSLTWGMGLAQPERDSFPSLFVTMLRERFEDPDITLIGAGIPGETSAGGLQRLERDVLAPRPDLVLVQYGGNDEYQNVPSTEYQENLRQIVRRVQEAHAAVLLATPPMKETQLDTLFPRAAREVAAELQLPVADFDTAVKTPPSDSRGPFPLGEHPHEYSHARMAQALYAAFEEAVRFPTPFAAFLVEGAWDAPLGAEAQVKAQVRNGAQEEHSLQLTLTVDAAAASQPLTVRPGAQGEAVFPVMLPTDLDRGRAWTRRLWLAARNEAGGAFDLKWLTVAPVAPCPAIRQAPLLTEDGKDSGLWETRLGEANLLSNPQDWNGLYDLGVSFGLARDEKDLYVLVRVLDDRMLVRDPDNDGVECFFDLRPPDERGRPVYDDRCFALAARPSSYGQWARISALGREPEGWTTMEGTSRRHYRGYSLLLTIPLLTLERLAGESVSSFGFDLMVHDADTSGQRKTTLAWSGRRDNLINPSGFGEVRLVDEVEEGTARVAVF